jgi:hypothetical protein
MHIKNQDTKPVQWGEGSGIRERRQNVGKDDEPTVYDVDAVVLLLAALTRRQPLPFFDGKSAPKCSFDVFCIRQS